MDRRQAASGKIEVQQVSNTMIGSLRGDENG